MPAAGVAAALQHVEEADQVRLGIGVRVDEGVAHADLRTEIHHERKPVRGEQFGHANAVGEIEFFERKARERF